MNLKSGLRVVALLLLVGLMFSVASAQGAVTSSAMDSNVRSGPGTEWRILGVARAGTTIALDGQAFGGNWVRGITSGGIVGWMFRENLRIQADAAAALPPVYLETPFSLAAPAQEGGLGGGGSVFTTTFRVNVRSGPHETYRRLGGLEAGATLNVDGKDRFGGWVRGISSSGLIGWVSASFVSGDLGGLRVVDRETPFGLSVPSAPAPTDTVGTSPDIPVANTAPVAGFNLGGHVASFGQSTVDWMRVAGMSWVKKQVVWMPGNDPNGVRGMIDEAHAQGFRILLGVVGQAGRVTEGGYFEQYAAYVGGLAAAGADAIEVWNEPNIDREWASGAISGAMYTELLRQSYFAIKAANPGTLVISAAPSPTGYYGGCSPAGCDDNFFIRDMAAAGAANYMDCVGVHYNEGILPPTATSGDPRGNSGHYTRYYPSMVNTYYNAFGGRKKLCFTELGYVTGEGYGQLPDGFIWASNTTVAQQASWIDQVVSIAGNSGKVLILIVWNIDFTGWGSDPQAGYALIRPGGDCPACRALAN